MACRIIYLNPAGNCETICQIFSTFKITFFLALKYLSSTLLPENFILFADQKEQILLYKKGNMITCQEQ